MDPGITAAEIRDRIKARAHAMWEADGKPYGMEEQHWIAAEKEILEEVDRSGATGPSVADAVAREPRAGTDLDQRQEELLDEAVEETFPASDPISPKRIT